MSPAFFYRTSRLREWLVLNAKKFRSLVSKRDYAITYTFASGFDAHHDIANDTAQR